MLPSLQLSISAAANMGDSMLNKLMGAALGAALALASLSAKAATIQGRWQTETESFWWYQDTNPTPNYYHLGSGTGVPVSGQEPFPEITNIEFFNSSQGGGFNAGYGIDIATDEQIYSGSEDHPVFTAGVSYSLYDLITGEVGTLQFLLTAAPPVPETPTWAMMLGGFASLSALAIAKRRRTLTT
jgi:hypothetical protein